MHQSAEAHLVERVSTALLIVADCRRDFNPLALQLDIYSSAHHLCKM